MESLLGTDAAAAAAAARGGGRTTIATSETIDEGMLHAFAREITPSGASFIAALNFVTTVITFIHRHLLFSRPNLASMLGNHLFGTHPIVLSKDDSRC